MGRIRVSRKRKVATRMEEEKLNTEADYFESSETRQDDVCTEVSNDLFSNTDWYGRKERGPRNEENPTKISIL